MGGGAYSVRENLRKARKAVGLTQQAMADKLGISLRYYQQIEAGDRTGDFTLWHNLFPTVRARRPWRLYICLFRV